MFDNSAEPDLVVWELGKKGIHFINLEFINVKFVVDRPEVKVR